jgi:hypothetical protein
MLLPAAAALLLCGCRHFPESEATHILHPGETGFLVHPHRAKVCVALNKADIHPLARAEDSGDESAIAGFVNEGKAIEVAVNTKVKVVSESYNERKLQILDGPHKGKVAWVAMEWLKLRQAPEPARPPIS